MVKAVGVVEVEAMRADASGSDSTRVLSGKSNVDNFSKNVFDLCILMYHAMMKCDNHTISR